MQVIQPWETHLIIWLRTVLPDLVGPFEAITALGGETFLLVLLPLLYWCVDRQLGARATILYLSSTYINGLSKLLFSMPRPLDAEPHRPRPEHLQGEVQADGAEDTCDCQFEVDALCREVEPGLDRGVDRRAGRLVER